MIPELGIRGNRWLEIGLLPAIIVLIAIAGFGLGRLSALQGSQDKLIIHAPLSTGGEATTTAVH